VRHDLDNLKCGVGRPPILRELFSINSERIRSHCLSDERSGQHVGDIRLGCTSLFYTVCLEVACLLEFVRCRVENESLSALVSNISINYTSQSLNSVLVTSQIANCSLGEPVNAEVYLNSLHYSQELVSAMRYKLSCAANISSTSRSLHSVLLLPFLTVTMLSKITALLFLSSALAAPLEPELQRRACPNIHVFGARETTAPAGFGSSGTVINLILNAHPGATSEAINYPAAGGDSYGASVVAGVQAVTSQVATFANQCPDTMIVLVGYSQVCNTKFGERISIVDDRITDEI
jgi:hypothetical protein